MRATLKVGLIVSLLAMFGLAMFGLTGCGLVFDTSEEPLDCEAGETDCGGLFCVDTSSSERHCGACGVECDDNARCIDGTCTAPEPCTPGECAVGQFCSADTDQCEPGCVSDANCGAEQFCDTEIDACQCPDGREVCGGGACCDRVSGETRLSSARDYSTLDLALDASGRAHLVTQPRESQAIEYLVADDQGSFSDDTVQYPNVPDVIPGGQTLDIDPSGTPHIAFLERRDDTATLYHAFLEGSEWTIEPVSQFDGGYAIPSILAPTADSIHIAHRNITPRLMYFERANGTWEQTTVAGELFHGAPQLAIDQNDDLKLAIWDDRDDRVHVTRPRDFAGGQSFPSDIIWRAPGLAFDSQNHPHLVYGAYDTQELRYTEFDGDSFSHEVLGAVRLGADPRIAIDSSDNPHIVFVRRDSTQVVYVWREADTWHREVVGQTVEGGGYSSERWVDIEMADGDAPVIAYVTDEGRISVVRLTR
ncbi:MAG: hypothetical protein ACQEVA_04270 [Myxococcota bacterium]